MTQNMVCMYPTTLVVNFHPEYSVHGMYAHTVLYLPLHTYIQRIPRSTPKLWKWSVKVKNPLRQRKHSTKVFFSLNGDLGETTLATIPQDRQTTDRNMG